VLINRKPLTLCFWISYTNLKKQNIFFTQLLGFILVRLLDDVQWGESIPCRELLALAQVLANQAATATENARLYAETNRRLKEQIALHEAAAVISSTLDLDTVLNHIVEQLGMVVDASSAYLCSYEPESMTSTVLFEYFSPRASEKELVSDLHGTYPLPRDFTIDFDLLQAGQSEIVHIDDPDMNEYQRGHMEAYGAMTILNILLRVGGRIIAFAELWESEYRREFSPEEISLCQAIAQQAAVALENARLYDRARQEIEERKQTERALQRVVARNEAMLNAIPIRCFILIGMNNSWIANWSTMVSPLKF
jgi:GAF domain-containing protein